MRNGGGLESGGGRVAGKRRVGAIKRPARQGRESKDGRGVCPLGTGWLEPTGKEPTAHLGSEGGAWHLGHTSSAFAATCWKVRVNGTPGVKA